MKAAAFLCLVVVVSVDADKAESEVLVPFVREQLNGVLKEASGSWPDNVTFPSLSANLVKGSHGWLSFREAQLHNLSTWVLTGDAKLKCESNPATVTANIDFKPLTISLSYMHDDVAMLHPSLSLSATLSQLSAKLVLNVDLSKKSASVASFELNTKAMTLEVSAGNLGNVSKEDMTSALGRMLSSGPLTPLNKLIENVVGKALSTVTDWSVISQACTTTVTSTTTQATTTTTATTTEAVTTTKTPATTTATTTEAVTTTKATTTTTATTTEAVTTTKAPITTTATTTEAVTTTKAPTTTTATTPKATHGPKTEKPTTSKSPVSSNPETTSKEPNKPSTENDNNSQTKPTASGNSDHHNKTATTTKKSHTKTSAGNQDDHNDKPTADSNSGSDNNAAPTANSDAQRGDQQQIPILIRDDTPTDQTTQLNKLISDLLVKTGEMFPGQNLQPYKLPDSEQELYQSEDGTATLEVALSGLRNLAVIGDPEVGWMDKMVMVTADFAFTNLMFSAKVLVDSSKSTWTAEGKASGLTGQLMVDADWTNTSAKATVVFKGFKLMPFVSLAGNATMAMTTERAEPDASEVLGAVRGAFIGSLISKLYDAASEPVKNVTSGKVWDIEAALTTTQAPVATTTHSSASPLSPLRAWTIALASALPALVAAKMLQ